MPGGGGQQGGAVVGGPSPQAAMLAGQYGLEASNAASAAATQAMNTAIQQINKQYNQARYDMQPYRTTGVQALDQLNQYLGLDPYNPGAAPTKPDEPTLDYLKSRITDAEIRNYIMGNTSAFGGPRNMGVTYGGVGSYSNNPNAPGYVAWGANQTSLTGLLNGAMNDSRIRPAVIDYLAQQKLLPAQDAYKTDLEAYNRNLDEYNQNLDWYNQYSAEGPLTSQQITERISNLPGYQSELAQGIDAIQKAGSAKGYLGSGRMLKELSQYGQNTLSTFYGNELSRLAGLAGQGNQAAQVTSNNAQQQGSALASLYASLGENQANSILSGGNALAQSILAGNQQYKVIGGSDGGGGLGGIGSVLGGLGSLISGFSSKQFKNYVSTPSTQEILDRVDQLSIDKWKYKDIDVNHIGPYAEEFKEFFKVGDGKTINMIDMMGVLLASVKELSKQVKSLQENR